MKHTIILLLFSYALCSFKDNKNDLTLSISSAKNIFQGVQDIKINAEITNHSGKDIYLIGNVDGAESKYRFPNIYFLFVDAKGDTLKLDHSSCPEIDELQVKNFKLIKADSIFNPFPSSDDQKGLVEHGYWPPSYIMTRKPVKGTFKVQLIYSTNCTDLDKWKKIWWDKIKKPTPTLDSLISLVPKVELKSNWLNVTIK
jgi:hypothetical protein